MTLFLRILILISSSLLGITLYALTFNLLQFGNLMPSDAADTYFGEVLTNKATFVWLGAVVIGLCSLFVQKKGLRIAMLIAPLLIPSIFAVIYTLIQ